MKQSLMFSMIAATLVTAAPVMTAPASAQPMAADLLPPYEVSTIIASMGMRPIDRPMWRNGRYVVHATDRSGRDVRVVLDGRDGQVIAVRPIDRGYDDGPRYAPPPPAYSGRYPAPPSYGPRYDDGYRAAPPAPPPADIDDDDDFDYDRQQGSLMPRPVPPAYGQPPADQRRITSIAPDRKVAPQPRAQERAAAPIPRPKPSIASVTPPTDKPAEPASTGSTKPEAKPEARKPDPAKTDPAQFEAKAEPGKSAPDKGEQPKTEIRVIDLSKPKPAEDKKPEDKAAEAKPDAKAPDTKAADTKAPEAKSSENQDKPAGGIRF